MEMENKEAAATAESAAKVPESSNELTEVVTDKEELPETTTIEHAAVEINKTMLETSAQPAISEPPTTLDEVNVPTLPTDPSATVTTNDDAAVPAVNVDPEPTGVSIENTDECDSSAMEVAEETLPTEPSVTVTTNDDAAAAVPAANVELAPIAATTENTAESESSAMEVAEETAIQIHSNVLLTPAPAVSMVEQVEEPHVSPIEIADKTVPTTGLGLSLLAQYDSDDSGKESDTESVIEVPTTGDAQKDYRTQVVEINSDSDDSSSSDSDSDVEYLSKIRKQIDKTIAAASDDDDDEDDDNDDQGKKVRRGKKNQPLKVQGELLLDDLPPIQDLQITVPEDECVELGRVHSIVDQLMLVSALPDSMLLDLDTVLFLERGQKVLGAVFDVLGQVADPIYCVRFNSHAQIVERGINVGDTVYVAPKTEYTQFVILSSLMKIRGSDASWENDTEPPRRFIEYSDDEQERDARKERRNKDRPNEHEDETKRARVADSSAEESANSAPQRRRNDGGGSGGAGRGGNGSNYRSPRRQSYNNASNTPTPPGHGYHNQYQQHQQQQQHHPQQQRPNYNSNFNPGSWHSNFYQPPPHQRGGPPPRNYGMPPAPAPHLHHLNNHPGQHQHSNSMFSSPPPTFNNAYGMPPQMPPQQPMYVMNPYAMRPPVIPPNNAGGSIHQRPMQSLYSTPPPPPPPGAQ